MVQYCLRTVKWEQADNVPRYLQVLLHYVHRYRQFKLDSGGSERHTAHALYAAYYSRGSATMHDKHTVMTVDSVDYFTSSFIMPILRDL